MAVAGTPLAIEWNRKRRIFRCRFRADSAITAPTVLYIPAEFFGKAPEIKAHTAGATADMRWEYQFEAQRLFVYNGSCNGEVEIVVRGGPVST
jgi:hypothetical protein